MPQTITGDPSVNLDLVLRRNRNASISFDFVNGDGSDHNITDDFELNVKITGDKETTVIHLTAPDGIEIVGNRITATFTDDQTELNKNKYFWELKNLTTVQNWYTGDLFLVTGERPTSTSEVNTTVNTGGQVIESTITLSTSASDEVPIEAFATELTFDNVKDLATVSGGTRTFTLAASGHLNGVGIVAKINEPVAVNFPAAFEAVSGSDEISAAHMNIIMFRYFSDYDGAGNAKVLYVIKNQVPL